MSNAISVVSFSKDVAPLFRPSDIEQMKVYGVLLNKYEWLSKPANARLVFAYLSGQRTPRMPLGGPYWSDEQVNLFLQWMNGGYQP
ncbi:MAG: hypothetical protein JWO91_2527 [Acidobacteriaceae bacterium]|jgi:hypothetical protein|nr:hypothetical protein [Acidobacteriaceae bacterium]